MQPRWAWTATTVLSGVDSVRYATTLGTNALIERKGPQVGALVTAGFEATIPLSRGRGYGEGLDELGQQRPVRRRPGPTRSSRSGSSARCASGLTTRAWCCSPLDEDDVRQQLRELVDAGAEALVVCLTNAVENPVHELRIQEIFLEEYPAHQLGAIPMLLSHQLSGRKGEYVRATSTIVDAFLHSTMYHAPVGAGAEPARRTATTKPMLVNHNSGGMAQLNSTDALQTIHSGPVAGVAASEHLARQAGLGNVVATDMGGTSFDIGLVPAGGVKHYDFMPVIDRWLVSVPDDPPGHPRRRRRLDRQLRPAAPVDPGRAAERRLGSRARPATTAAACGPTVTDADLLLGYLDPASYAGGRIPLNPKRAAFAIEEEFGDHLDLRPVEVAKLIKAEVDEQMANGMAKELRVRGYLPEEFTMLAYGGNGPLHAAASPTTSASAGCSPRRSARCSPRSARATPRSCTSTSATAPSLLYDATTRRLFDDFEPLQRDRRGTGGQGPRGPAAAGTARRRRCSTGSSWTCATATSWSPWPWSPTSNRLHSVHDVLDVIGPVRRGLRPALRRTAASRPRPASGSRPSASPPTSKARRSSSTPRYRRSAGAGDPDRLTAAATSSGTTDAVDTPVYDETALQPGQVVPGPAIVTTRRPPPTWSNPTGAWRPAPHGAIWFLKNATAGDDK